VQGAFCSACGEKIDIGHKAVKTNKGILFTCAACIVLAFVFLGLCIGSAYTSDGFNFQYQYSGYSQNANGFVKKATDKSSGDTWEVSFSEASDGYTFKRTYNAKTKVSALTVEIRGGGTVRLIITQNEAALEEIIGTGSYDYDMAAFGTGKITLKIVNVDASDFSSALKMK
jgi:hypothetical protein